MNRAQRRLQERELRLNEKKNSITMKRDSFKQMQTDISNDVSMFTVDIMMTSFALILYEEFGFDLDQITVCLNKLDDYMGQVNNDEITVDDLREKLKEETGLLIKSSNS